MPLTITTFNIQNFGEKRSNQRDRLEQVAAAILLIDPAPDIIGLVEITVSDTAAACELLDLLCKTLSKPPKYFGRKGRDYKYIISEFNGFESYVFLYDPNTITSVVCDIDNVNLFEKKFYTLDDNQPKGYPEFKKISFKINKNNDNTTAKKVKIIGDTKTCVYNTFPLIHFNNRSTCRPPGLGIFIHKNVYFGVLLWHNMSGDDSPSYSYMYHLGESAIVKKSTFNILEGKNSVTIKNLIVTGDFNVDEIDSNSNDPDPYEIFVTNKMTKVVSSHNALSLLNYYHHDWDYETEMDTLTRAFDNIFYRCPDFNFNYGQIEDLFDILLDDKEYLLRFFAQSEYMGGIRDYDVDYYKWDSVKSHPYGNYLYTKMSTIKKDKKKVFSVSDCKEVTIDFMQERRLFRKNKKPRLDEARKILGDRFDKFYREAFSIHISPTEFIAGRYSKLKEEEEEKVLNGDVIFYLREFVSDHLPVSITFK